MTTSERLLDVVGLRTVFRSSRGPVQAVNGVSFHLDAGEIVGVVGESGCGKSATALSVMRLIPDPPGTIAAGSVRFKGRDLLTLSGRAMRDLRGKDISMIFQDPMTSLNPMLRIRRQMTEGIQLHMGLNKQAAMERAIEMLRLVGIPSPERRIHDYPHQLSGGMRQRVVIAIALSCNPSLVLADEPTTALDVTIQAQILELLRRIMRERNTAVMLITHDLGVVAGMCDRVLVMYAGSIVEEATRREIFYNPRHPYTLGLLRSVPRLDRVRTERLPQIEGLPPDLARLPQGCPFQARCPYVTEICRREMPPLRSVESDHRVACHHEVRRADVA
jgi:oligopeptide/dipeptide ABC transporter ATP-binding protein